MPHLKQVRGQKNRRSRLGPRLEPLHEHLAPVGIEAEGWLVEQEHGGVGQFQEREAQALSHAAGEGAAGRIGCISKGDLIEERVEAVGRGVPKARVEAQHLPGGERLVEAHVLGEEGEAFLSQQASGSISRHVHPVHGGRPGIRRGKSRQDVQGRGLARAVGAYHCGDGARLHRERCAVQDGLVAVGLL